MGLTSPVPGMRPERSARNAVLSLLYLACLTLVVPVVCKTYRPIRGC